MFFYRQNLDWRRRNPERWRAIFSKWKRKRYANDPAFRLKNILGVALHKGVCRQGDKRAHRIDVLIGCTIAQLKAHLERLFLPGMTWENRGRFGWHIDHIRAVSKFDLSDPKQQLACFHYSNLQPLWWRDNLLKTNK